MLFKLIFFQVGSLCLEIIEYELNRYSQLKTEVDSRNTPNTSSAPLVSRLPLPRSIRKPAEKKKSPSGRYIMFLIYFFLVLQ